jgi:hypothetical protein
MYYPDLLTLEKSETYTKFSCLENGDFTLYLRKNQNDSFDFVFTHRIRFMFLLIIYNKIQGEFSIDGCYIKNPIYNKIHPYVSDHPRSLEFTNIDEILSLFFNPSII